jgi:pimeloyl-ACP methyl ester carboxylesterase
MHAWARRVGFCVLAVLAVVVVLAAWQWKGDLPLGELKARWAPPPSRFIDVDGMSVHYRDEGVGPPVLLLHGTGASLYTWNAWAAVLSSSHRVVRLDLPAFGLTGPRPDRDYTMGTYVEFLDRFAARLGLDSFALAGNSFGGTLAWRFAAAHPAEVTQLVLVDAGGYPGKTKRLLVFRLGGLPILRQLLAHMDPRLLVERTIRQAYGDPARVTPELIERSYELVLRPGNREAFGAETSVPFEDRTALLANLRVPTLVMWGDRDALIPVSDAQRFAADIPGARVRVYEGLGHLPMEEDGARTALDVSEFLATAQRARASATTVSKD